MKQLVKTAILITFLFGLIKNNMLAQQWTGSTTNTGTITHNGPVMMGFDSKIGTGTGLITFGDGYNNVMWGLGCMGFNLEKNASNWNYLSNGYDNGCGMFYMGLSGDFYFSSRQSNATVGAVGGTLTPTDINNNVKMKLTATGKLVIGSVSTLNQPGTYRLYVQDGILTERVKVAVKNSADWADNVFSSDYKLKPLSDIATYIEEHKHLPDVPSAEDVVNSGVDLGKMDATLLQKVEELTLYMIELKKENEKLKKMFADIQSKKNQ